MLPTVQSGGSILEQVAVIESIPILLMFVILKIINSRRLVTCESLHDDGTQIESVGLKLLNKELFFNPNWYMQ